MPITDVTSMKLIKNGWEKFSNVVQNSLTDAVASFLKAHTGADLYIVTGHAGVGKSSYIKSITGEDVYIGSTLESGTNKISLVPAVIGSKRSLFLDMPGFNTRDFDDWDIFYKLMTAMSVVRPYVEFRGVIYVDSMKENRVTPAVEKILTWLFLFCGQNYMPNVTIVTTNWSGNDPDGIEEKLTRVEQWKEERLIQRFLLHGATIYHHGLVENADEKSGKYTTLHVNRKTKERGSLARDYIAARYRNSTNLQLQVYVEIANGATIDTTLAGKWIRNGHAHPQDDEQAGSNASTGNASAHGEQHRWENQTNGNSESSEPEGGRRSSGFWEDLRKEDIKTWITLLIKAARIYASWSYEGDPFDEEDFTSMFEDDWHSSDHVFSNEEEEEESTWDSGGCTLL